jgi:hypothetical protein
MKRVLEMAAGKPVFKAGEKEGDIKTNASDLGEAW